MPEHPELITGTQIKMFDLTSTSIYYAIFPVIYSLYVKGCQYVWTGEEKRSVCHGFHHTFCSNITTKYLIQWCSFLAVTVQPVGKEKRCSYYKYVRIKCSYSGCYNS
jgi:hypothetical protein